MNKKHQGLFILQLLCISGFVFIDFFVPQYRAVSNILKYIIVCSAFLYALPLFTALPLGLTVVCDYFLLFTTRYETGVALFIGVHLCYCFFLIYNFSQVNINKKLLSLFLLLACFLFLLPLTILAICYVAIFLIHIATLVKLNKKMPIAYYRHYLIALFLFAACDIFTALNFICGFPSATANIIWLFYSPSQMILGALMSLKTSTG